MRVVITGGTKGIGKAIADAFAAEGAHIAICSRTAEQLTQVKDLLERKHKGCKVLTCQADVSKKGDVHSFSDAILREWGEVDVLVNNAGVFIPGSISDEPEGALERMIETNLYSAYRLTRSLLPSLIRSKGHIFNICSIASLFAYPNGGSYSISKFALLGMSKVLREELKEKGVRVTAVLPGATWSNSWAGVDLPYERPHAG